ncbi:hypothetical protein N7492_007288 [Penicillium capsulatum]|uniref:Choline kinase N-terminal domain-containing protein n=1 Tax=Penicillium capsulatum TaxID=69766 RepID=A0A9W9LLY8_9EURO|nr:hypothetical protein N7492_007288 [Penicillium capsulatum]KAJ6117128.1 hypothetical protein N7512_006853 [Penicillium capsulatum]
MHRAPEDLTDLPVDAAPISGTGLNIPSLRKALEASGANAGSPPDGSSLKQYRAPVAKVSARPPVLPPTSMPSAVSSQSSIKQDTSTVDDTDQSTKPEEDPQLGLFNQVSEWLEHEKTRRKARKARRAEATKGTEAGSATERDSANESPGSESSFSLDMLEKILVQFAEQGAAGRGLGSFQPIKRSTRRRPKGLRRGSASESDATDLEAPVPSVEAVLDNSKTLAYTCSSAADEDTVDNSSASKRAKDREAWNKFRTDIVRLAHTLQLRGWRKVPMEMAGNVEVARLSGALTNAVYVVAPPKNLPPPRNDHGSSSIVPRKPPPKLLLRIYGPQVDHLIDREKELQILRRLGRKHIGPRVLGTFLNGRFEEYFEARTLTPKDLRIPETAKQIAKRMRELHDGIDLLDVEREGGPMVFKNWEKWVDRCGQVMTWLDKELQSPQNEVKAVSEPWRRRGFVCGVPWERFREAVNNYRGWLVASCGGIEEIKRKLVFAHNDTQYGNLLRMEPATESPLLLPANEHKRLVVIDFEYSSANTPGHEFANHFTEWCYNYHDEEYSWACNDRLYPTPEEQRRFISTYLSHRPNVPGGPTSPLGTPSMRGRPGVNIAPLDLDESEEANLQQLEKSQEEEFEAEIQYLMKQTRLWRVMNSAFWVAWGIIQAKAPGMEEGIAEMVGTSAKDGSHNNGDGHDGQSPNGNGESKTPDAEAEAEEDGFDYLAYAQDRAMFFWSDLLALGLVNPDELPAPMVEHIRSRILEY